MDGRIRRGGVAVRPNPHLGALAGSVFPPLGASGELRGPLGLAGVTSFLRYRPSWREPAGGVCRRMEELAGRPNPPLGAREEEGWSREEGRRRTDDLEPNLW